jgi:hypothetical protein
VIRATDLTGCVVRTELGKKVGRVHDLRLQSDGTGAWRLVGIVLGRGGMSERLGIARAGRPDPIIADDFVRWQAILRLEEGLITVRDDEVPH